MATGVLPLVIGRATRLAQFFSAGEKAYDARMQFGWSTDTYDREGERTSEPVEPHFSREELHAALDRFRGTFLKRRRRFRPRKSRERRRIGWRAKAFPWSLAGGSNRIRVGSFGI